MEDGEKDKTEEPTQFKLARARQQGSVARGADLGFLVGLGAFLGCALVFGGEVFAILGQSMRGGFVSAPQLAAGPAAVFATAGQMIAPIVLPVAIGAGVIMAGVLLFELVQTGFVFSAKPLKPDFAKLNPARGFKRIFSFRLLVETLKNVLKMAAYTAVAYWVVTTSLRSDAPSAVDGQTLLASMGHVAVRLIAAFIAVAIFFAIVDQLIVRRDFSKKMRMSRREVRRELRDREGEPRMKQKRKQMHAEFVRLAQSVRNIRKADVLIINPQHLAIALQYDPRTMTAPRVVSLGAGHLALRLKRLAFLYGVPTVENRPLAWAIYRKGALNMPIPEGCYRPVADIYNRIRQPVLTRPAMQTEQED